MSFPPFDKPLAAGSIAYLHPGSLVMDFELTRSAITDMNAGDELAARLREHPSSSTRGEIFRTLPLPTQRFFAVRGHEQDHLRRVLSTTYGFLADHLRCLWLTHLGWYVHECAIDSTAPLLPLKLLCPANGSDFATAAAAMTASPSPFTKNVWGLAELLVALTDNVSPTGLAAALWPLSRGDARRLGELTLGIDLSREVCSAHRVVDAAGREYGLSARHLLELFAIGEHGNAFLRLGASPTDLDGLLAQEQGEYVLAILAWRAAFGADDLADEPPAPDDLVIDCYRLFPFELYVCADLALWPPFLPTGDFATRDGVMWADIDPGRRFARAIAVLRRMGVKPSPIPAAGRNERLLELQAAVCDELGWPSPHDLASEWVAVLERAAKENVSPWAALDGSSGYRVRTALGLLSQRLKRPADVVFNNLSYAEHGVRSSPVWLFHEDEGGRTPVAMFAEADLAPYMVMEAARQLVERDRVAMTSDFPLAFRRSAVDLLGRMWARECDWDSTLVGRLLADMHREYEIQPG